MECSIFIIAVLVGCGGGKQEETQESPQPEPAGIPKVTLPSEPQLTPKPTAENPKPPKVVPEKRIADTIVEKAIREELKKPAGELTKADLENLLQLKQLILDGNQLSEVTGLENLTQLTRLGLNDSKPTDVKGLEKLTKLTILNFTGNQLTDVPKALEELPQLKVLELVCNQLTDVKGLKKLTQLRELSLGYNQLKRRRRSEKSTVIPRSKHFSL